MGKSMKKQAAENRAAAKVLRTRGDDTSAQHLEARADELDSGRVTDVTESVSALIRWSTRR